MLAKHIELMIITLVFFTLFSSLVIAPAKLLKDNTFVKGDRVLPTGINKSDARPATSPFDDQGFISAPRVQTNTSDADLLPSTRGPVTKCGELEKLQDRVRCRAKSNILDTDDTPEDCRVVNATQKIKCKSLHTLVARCVQETTAQQKFACARQQFILQDIPGEKAQCATKEGSERDGCAIDLVNRVDAMVIFRFEELARKAKQFLQKDAITENQLVDFMTTLDLKKMAYAKAKNTTEKTVIVNEVRELWKNVVTQATQ